MKSNEAKAKYDWSNVPDWVQWMATDADGYRTMWSEKPTQGTSGWIGAKGASRDWFWPNDQYAIKNNWYESLEHRPNPCSQCPNVGHKTCCCEGC